MILFRLKPWIYSLHVIYIPYYDFFSLKPWIYSLHCNVYSLLWLYSAWSHEYNHCIVMYIPHYSACREVTGAKLHKVVRSLLENQSQKTKKRHREILLCEWVRYWLGRAAWRGRRDLLWWNAHISKWLFGKWKPVRGVKAIKSEVKWS